jgi:PAS domain S-box-containing protein
MLQKLGKQVPAEPTVDGAGQLWVSSIATAVAVGIAYFLAARVGLALRSELEGVALFWPASGIAAGILIARGPSARKAVAIGVIVATVAANLMSDRSLWAAIAKGFCNAGEALLTAWLVERWFGPRFELDSLRRTVGFLAAATVGAATAAVGGAVAMRLFHTAAPLLDIWRVWFLASGLGIVTIAPLLIGIARAAHDPPKLAELAEGMLALLVLVVVSVIGFASPTDYWVTILPLALLFPLLLWPAARCRPVFAAAAVFILTSSIVWTITFGIGRLGDRSVPIGDRVHAAQATLLAITVCALALAALFAERRQHEAALAERDAHLALAGKTALVGSYVFDINTGRMQVSAGYAAIYGLAEATEEFARDEWQARVHPEDLGRLDTRRNAAFAERRLEHKAEFRILRPGGEVRWIESRAYISYDGDGRPERMVGINIDVTERKRAEEHQGLLIAELDHRVKNVLASVAVIAKRTSERSASNDEFIDAFDRRIQSMAETQALLSRSRWRGVSLADLVRRELAPYASGGNTLVKGPYVGLTAAATQAMAMVLHELTTNAAKYGALSTPQGCVLVRWHRASNGGDPTQLRLEWRESGGPAVTVPAQPSYGTSVIRDLIPYELGGTVEIDFAAGGVGCTIEILLEAT